jgi:hypothetical protein
MNDAERFLTEILLNAVGKILKSVQNETLRLICEAYSEQIVPEIAKQITKGQLDIEQIPICLPSHLQQELNAIVKQTAFVILDKIASRLPEGKARDFFIAEVKRVSDSGIEEYITNDAWQGVLAEQVKQYASGYAIIASRNALRKAKEYFPDSQYSAVICANAEVVAVEIIEAAASGEDVDTLFEKYVGKASQYVKDNVKQTAAQQINKAVDEAVDFMADKAREKGRGQRHSRYNKKVDQYAETIRTELKDNAGFAVERILNG